MRKLLLIGAMLFSGTSAYAEDVIPCDQVNPDEFYAVLRPQSGFSVMDVTDLKKEKGSNVCSVIIESTGGTVKFYFTTYNLRNGRPAWKQLRFEMVKE